MFEIMSLLLVLYSGQESFSSLIQKDYPYGSRGYTTITKAHALAKEEFKNKYRESGEQYLRHLESVALIVSLVLTTLGRRDHAMIIAALLHDLLEDIPGWTHQKLARKFGDDVADLVQWVTKGKKKEYAGNSSLRDAAYQTQLRQAPVRAVVLKLSDQLHNLITLWAKSLTKQRAKVRLAKTFYLPLAEKHNILWTELISATTSAEVRLSMVFWVPESILSDR